MSDDLALSAYESIPRSEVVRHIRRLFGVTQARLATAMGTSVKAIQSYEQGWRKVPTRVLVQLLVLLAIHRRREIDAVPCWDTRNCTAEDREDCASHAIGDGQFCWFVSKGRRVCSAGREGTAPGSDSDVLPCMGCEVIQRLLRTEGDSDLLVTRTPGAVRAGVDPAPIAEEGGGA